MGGDIHGLYRHMYMLGAPTNLISSGYLYNTFGNLSFTNNNTVSLQKFISSLHARQKNIL